MNGIITIKAYNRHIYLAKVLYALSNCINIENYEVLISIDTSNTRVLQNNVIKESNLISRCKNLSIHYHDERVGCAGNTKFCLEKAFAKNIIDYVVHFEDDTLPAKDCLLFFEHSMQLIDSISFFAACAFTRNCHIQKPQLIEDVAKLVLRYWFDAAGGFCIHRKSWQSILNKGGMFGINRVSAKGRLYNCHGEMWLREISKNSTGSWMWPFEKYFRDYNIPCLYPVINRAQNIGQYGFYTPSIKWYEDNIYNPIWTGMDDYNKIVQFDTFCQSNLNRISITMENGNEIVEIIKG